MRERIYKNVWLLCATLILTVGCTKPDRSEEATALNNELVNEAISDMDKALARVDSAEESGLFTAARANFVRASIYENAQRRQLAAYYAGKVFAEDAVVTTPADSNLYCLARWVLADGAYVSGEYGKSLSLTKDILAFMGDASTPNALAIKCRALSMMADCESKLSHIAESERLFLQCIDIMMESTQHATKFGEVEPLIYTLLSLNVTRCPNTPEWVIQKRRNNVTISKVMVYVSNGQRDKAEALFREHQQSQGLDAVDKMAEGVYLTRTGRYDEAIRLIDEADSMLHSDGAPIANIYVITLLNYKYDVLQKAGRTAEALAMSDRIRHLTDSIRQQERLADVEQMQEIKQQEEEIARKRQSLTIHRVILAAIVLLLLLAIYIIWRIHRYNRQLTEKNRSLYEQIQQREQAKAEEQRQLQAQPEESLTAEQQLYRRLCTLMAEQKPYTEETLNRDTLAQLLGTNAKYVVQAIHECSHGDTVMDFITRYRLEHVAHLLKTTDDPIALIGELSGIPSRATLARLFRNAYGMSCSEYRQVAQQK